MRIDRIDLVTVKLPFVRPFRTSYGTELGRNALLVRVTTDAGIEGWGENVAAIEPGYSYEFVAASELTIRDHLAPRILAAEELTPDGVADLLEPVNGWKMSKCALEAAVLDAWLRAQGQSFASFLGGSRTVIEPGVSVGLHDDVSETIREVGGYLNDGYCRVKLKIEPDRDVRVVAAIREAFGDDLLLQVDANAAYTLQETDHLRRLDDFGLLLIEQPLAEDDLWRHARLAETLETPICLDESITSARVAEDAIDMGACAIVNIKAGRVGGYLEAVRIHDLCRERSVPVWCGGMLETGIGRAANLALCTLPGFTLPPDVSASARYFAEDLVEPFVLVDGKIDVPTAPGMCPAPTTERLNNLGARWTSVG